MAIIDSYLFLLYILVILGNLNSLVKSDLNNQQVQVALLSMLVRLENSQDGYPFSAIYLANEEINDPLNQEIEGILGQGGQVPQTSKYWDTDILDSDSIFQMKVHLTEGDPLSSLGGRFGADKILDLHFDETFCPIYRYNFPVLLRSKWGGSLLGENPLATLFHGEAVMLKYLSFAVKSNPKFLFMFSTFMPCMYCISKMTAIDGWENTLAFNKLTRANFNQWNEYTPVGTFTNRNLMKSYVVPGSTPEYAIRHNYLVYGYNTLARYNPPPNLLEVAAGPFKQECGFINGERINSKEDMSNTYINERHIPTKKFLTFMYQYEEDLAHYRGIKRLINRGWNLSNGLNFQTVLLFYGQNLPIFAERYQDPTRALSAFIDKCIYLMIEFDKTNFRKPSSWEFALKLIDVDIGLFNAFNTILNLALEYQCKLSNILINFNFGLIHPLYIDNENYVFEEISEGQKEYNQEIFETHPYRFMVPIGDTLLPQSTLYKDAACKNTFSKIVCLPRGYEKVSKLQRFQNVPTCPLIGEPWTDYFKLQVEDTNANQS